jgi:flavodoxin I
MKTLIVYDSLYGNTEKIAQAIGGAVGGDVKVVKVGEASALEIGTCDLVVIGSPTQGGRHTKLMQEFLGKIPDGALKNKNVAAFDTRMKSFWVKAFGWAATRIADDLKEKGANLVAPAEPFYVNKGKGFALVEGELERAAAWAKSLAANNMLSV